MFWKKDKPQYGNWRIIAATAFIATLAINGLAASTTLLGGVTTAAVSDSYANLFAPSGFTFSIWSVIYTLLVIYLLSTWGVLRSKRHALRADAEVAVLKLFTLTCLLNSLWMFAWQYRVLWLSVVLMIGLLLTLKRIHALVSNVQHNVRSFVTTRLPFSIYLGWITVATVANITTWLVSVKWDGAGMRPGVWMVLIVLIAATIGVIRALRARDWAYMAVFIWAYGGILYKHLSSSGFNGQYPTTIGALEVSLAVFVVMFIYLVSRYPLGGDTSSKLFR